MLTTGNDVTGMTNDIKLLSGVGWRTMAVRALLFVALWWLLTGGASGAWVIGVPAVVLAVAASTRVQSGAATPVSAAGMLVFAGFFVLQSVKAGFQVAALALRPRLDLRPAILEITLRLPSQTEQLFLAGTVSLLPGTLSIGLDGKSLLLHVLDARLPVEREIQDLETRVARLFGRELQ